jgi:hypothetical protein
VVFLDALGIKGVLAREEPDDIIGPWEHVIASFKESILKNQQTERRICGDPADYHIIAFSDTIILAAACEDPVASIPLMAEIVCRPFILALMKSIYLRGVISLGKFHGSDRLMIGPAVDEAAEWYTQPDWIGVSAAPSAWFGINRLIDQGFNISEWFVKYDVPMKSGKEEDGWALAWPLQMPKETLEKTKNLTARTLILNAFASKPVGVAAASKYKNTLTYFDRVWDTSK